MKIFLFLLLMVAATLSGCNNDELNDIRSRLDKLEAWQLSMTSDISSLKSLVTALEAKDYVTKVTPLADGTGYVLTFDKSGDITIKHGKDGASPVLGTKQDTDGKYYWTVNGEWMMVNGAKVSVAGEAPRVRIENGIWEISTDGGKTWTPTGVKAQGDSIFDAEGIDNSNKEYIELTLADGTILRMMRYVPAHITGLDFQNQLIVSPQGRAQELELVMPTGLLVSDYLGISVEIVGDGWTDIITKTRAGNINDKLFKFDFGDKIIENGFLRAIPIYLTASKTAEIASSAIISVTVHTITHKIVLPSMIASVGGHARADYYPDEENPVGIVIRARINYNMPGLIVSLDEESLAWSTENVSLSILGTRDGRPNMDIIAQIPDWKTKYPAFAWCDAKNKPSAPSLRWFLPAISELPILYRQVDAVNTSLGLVRASLVTQDKYLSSNYFNDGFYQDPEKVSAYEFGVIFSTDKPSFSRDSLGPASGNYNPRHLGIKRNTVAKVRAFSVF